MAGSRAATGCHHTPEAVTHTSGSNVASWSTLESLAVWVLMTAGGATLLVLPPHWNDGAQRPTTGPPTRHILSTFH